MSLFSKLADAMGLHRPAFDFTALNANTWRCNVCDETVWKRQMEYHARVMHGWNAPNVQIGPRTRVVPL